MSTKILDKHATRYANVQKNEMYQFTVCLETERA